MITISDKAAVKIRELLQGDTYDDSYGVRVSVVSGGCSGLSYKMDFDNQPAVTDEVFEDKGLKIMCDRKSFFYLVGTELDFTEGLNAKGFHFVNPNAARTCGCGESFSL